MLPTRPQGLPTLLGAYYRKLGLLRSVPLLRDEIPVGTPHGVLYVEGVLG